MTFSLAQETKPAGRKSSSQRAPEAKRMTPPVQIPQAHFLEARQPQTTLSPTASAPAIPLARSKALHGSRLPTRMTIAPKSWKA
jgi:hypothetical protein